MLGGREESCLVLVDGAELFPKLELHAKGHNWT